MQGDSSGITIDNSKKLFIVSSNNDKIDKRTSSTRFTPITPAVLDYSVKAALCDGIGTAYTEEEKEAARERIGAERKQSYEFIGSYTLEEDVADKTTDTYPFSIISAEPNGTPFDFTEVTIVMNFTKEDVSGTLVYLMVYAGSQSVSSYIQSANNANYFKRAKVTASVSSGLLTYRSTNTGLIYGADMLSGNTDCAYVSESPTVYIATSNITKVAVRLPEGRTLHKGATLIIYGIRA